MCTCLFEAACVCMWVCVSSSVCMSMSVLLLVEGRMQPSRTLLLKLKRDPDIIFVQYL